MNITDLVSTDFVGFDSETPVSRALGAFEDPAVKAVLVSSDDAIEGVVTRRQLATSHRQPDQKLGSLVWSVPDVTPYEDVREVARLMLDSDVRVLPVFDGEHLEGVITADDLIQGVKDALDSVTVQDSYTTDLVTISSDASFGSALHELREHRITHLPVVDDGDAVGILSLYDITSLAARPMQKSQGGQAEDVGGVGGATSVGGYGAREGERERMLDLPVRDVMTTPVRTVTPETTLEAAVATMFEIDASSLVVVDETGAIDGIVTKSDVLDTLTWEAAGNRAVQVYRTELLDDVSYDDIVEMIDSFDKSHRDMQVLDAKIHLHEHDETLRGTPLLLARIRLSTDRGMFIGTGEGYGAENAINAARDIIARRIREEKSYGQSKKHPDEEYWEKRFGWWLES